MKCALVELELECVFQCMNHLQANLNPGHQGSAGPQNTQELELERQSIYSEILSMPVCLYVTVSCRNERFGKAGMY